MRHGCLQPMASQLLLECTVPTGIEKQSADEVQELLAGFGPDTRTEQGRVFITCAVDDEPQRRQAVQTALALRSVDNVYGVVWHSSLTLNGLESPDAMEAVTTIPAQVDWAQLLRTYELVYGEVPGGIESAMKHYDEYRRTLESESTAQPAAAANDEEAEPEVPSFRVTCYRTGEKHTFTSQEAAGVLGDHIQRHFGWKVQMKNMHLEIVLRIIDDQVSVSIPLNRESLFKRNMVAFGPTTLRSTIAYGLLRLAAPEPGDILLDPLCGTGAIPVEAFHAYKRVANVAIEINEKGISNCYTNAQAAEASQRAAGVGCGRSLDVLRADSMRMPWRSDCVDCIVTDLPFGKRMGSASHNMYLYPRLLSEFARVARLKTGRAVMLTQDKKAINKVLRGNIFWKLVFTTFVNVGGLRAHAYLVRRNETVWKEK